MKSLYTKALCLWTLVLLAGLTACRNERDDLPLSEIGSRTLRLSALMPADPTTRVALEEDSEHQVFRARWESGDKLTLIFEQGTQLTSPTEVPVVAIEADGKQAQAEIIVPASINIDEAYTVYAFCGTRGVRVSDKEILMNISPIRALHLKDLSVPVMSKVKVEPSSTSGEVAMDFTHLGSIEYVDLKNSSDTDLKVQGCSLTPINGADKEWRYLPHGNIRYLYKPMSDEVIEATDNGSEIEHPIEEVIIAPGESHTFATWHRPNGNNIPEFTLNMRTNKGTITSTQKKTSKTFAMTPGKAYRVEAEWKDNRLEILGEGVEENVSYITLTPNIEEESIGIGLNAAEEDQSEVWIDLNNNGTMDKGEKVTSFGEKEEYEILYPIRTERITIYGKIFYFSCYKQPMTTLDVTKAPFLVELRCRDNGLTSLDVSQNKLLKELNCDDNPQIKTLDVSQNINLTDLSCANTGLSELDVTKLTKLKDLDCSDNGLTSLDVSQNKALEDLVCNYNKLTTLDVSQNKALTYLYCSDNRIETLDISQNLNLETLHCSDCALTALDASKLSNLTTLDCSFNKIYDLKISASITNLLNCQSCGLSAETLDDLFGILPDLNGSPPNGRALSVYVEGNPGADDCHPQIATEKGWKVDVKGKPLPPHPKGSRMTLRTEKTVGDNIELTIDAEPKDRPNVWIDLNRNRTKDEGEEVTVFGEDYEYTISAQSITIYGEVTEFNCNAQEISVLDVSKNTALIALECIYNQLTSLNVSNNTALKHLDFFKNSLTSLNVSNNTALEYLDCGRNKLTSLDVSNNTALRQLYSNKNQLKKLDVSKNTELTKLYCDSTELTSLDVSKNTKLVDLDCGQNQLTSLDVSNNTALRKLNCYNNQLKKMDVSKNTELTELYCHSNKLTSLDISKNTELTELYCDGNELTSLDVSPNTKLRRLSCENNRSLSSLKIQSSINDGLWCYGCNLSAEMLNSIFKTLPDVKGLTDVDKTLRISNNPGTDTCDKKIATDKGWTIEYILILIG